jgi:hypothetical protein
MAPTTALAVGDGHRPIGRWGRFWLPPLIGASVQSNSGMISAPPVRDLQDRFARAELIGGGAVLEQLMGKIVGFVEAPPQGLKLPLDIRGTAFQQRVWQALREIPAVRWRAMRKPPGESASRKQCALWHKPACRTRLP